MVLVEVRTTVRDHKPSQVHVSVLVRRVITREVLNGLRSSSPPRAAGGAAAVEAAAQLGEVDGGCSGGGAVQAEVPGGRRFPGLLHTWERREDLLLRRGRGGGGECRHGRRGGDVGWRRGADGGQRGSGRRGGFIEGGATRGRRSGQNVS